MLLFYNFFQNIVSVFTRRNFFFHVLAIVLTFIIVVSGFDWSYFLFVRTIPIRAFLSPATGIGMVLPIFGLPLFFLIAVARKRKKLLLVSSALWQSAIIAWLVSSAYKFFTGRVQPPRGEFSKLVDMSRNWNFGFYEHGIFWGWPSSHTTVAFAMSFALITLFPKEKSCHLTCTSLCFLES